MCEIDTTVLPDSVDDRWSENHVRPYLDGIPARLLLVTIPAQVRREADHSSRTAA